jgi:hypothetical protein
MQAEQQNNTPLATSHTTTPRQHHQCRNIGIEIPPEMPRISPGNFKILQTKVTLYASIVANKKSNLQILNVFGSA